MTCSQEEAEEKQQETAKKQESIFEPRPLGLLQ